MDWGVHETGLIVIALTRAFWNAWPCLFSESLNSLSIIAFSDSSLTHIYICVFLIA